MRALLSSRDIRPDAVAIYIRWSTEEQGEGTTLEIQRERCALFARSQGWQVREALTFIDEGYSGANMERPAMKRLRQAVAAGTVDCVVSYKLDRLSRNLVDTVNLVRQEWAGKCIYRSATEGFDTSSDSPAGGLILNILASFAEFERAVIRDRTRAGSLRRMREGMYISGVVPFGYKRAGKGQLAVKPGEAETVARIFKLAVSSVVASATGIARQLNEEGLPGPGGGKWWSSAVSRLLRNPVYMGSVVYGRRNLSPALPGGSGRHDATGEVLADVAGTVPAIVSRELFEQAHALLLRRKESKPHKTNRASGAYLLTTVATCRCGGPLGAVKDRHGALYYRCQRKQQGVGCRARSVAFRGAPVEARIVQALRGRFGGSRHAAALALLTERVSSGGRQSEIDGAIKTVARKRADVIADLGRLRRQTRKGELSPSLYEELKADAVAELRELEERLRDLEAQHAASGERAATTERLAEALRTLDEWEALRPIDRKELLRALAERISICYPGRGEPVQVDAKWIGNNGEALAQALHTWALLLADCAERQVVTETKNRLNACPGPDAV